VTLSPDSLIQDLSVVRSYLGEDDAPAKKLEPIVEAISKAIVVHTQRQFWPDPRNDVDPPVAKLFRYDGMGYLSLAPYELRELEPGGVQMYTDYAEGSWYTVPDQTADQEAQYRLEPRNGTPEGTYTWMAMQETLEYGATTTVMTGMTTVMRRIERGVQATLTGRWGMTEPPPEAILACLITVDALWKNPEAYASRTLGFSLTTQPFTSLPLEAQAMLAGLKRRRVG
jgi:hypothetical protein